MRTRTRVVAGVAAGVVVVAGALVVRELAAPVYEVERAPEGGSRECAAVAERFPDRLDGLERRETTAAGTAVWGDGAVVLRCGVPVPKPTVDPCAGVGGVDWVFRERASRPGYKVLVSFGRYPAVEVVVSGRDDRIDAALVEMSRIAQETERMERHGKCIKP